MKIEMNDKEVIIDGERFVSAKSVTPDMDTLNKALSSLYQEIWIQACYDADNEATKKICRKLLPFIETANHILKFRT